MNAVHVLTCKQVVVPQQPVGGHAVDDLRQLRPVQALALDDGIAAVVGELYAVDGVRLQAQQLRRWRKKGFALGVRGKEFNIAARSFERCFAGEEIDGSSTFAAQ